MDNSGDIILVQDKKPGRWKKWVLIGIALLVLIGGGVTAFLLLNKGEKPPDEEISEESEDEEEEEEVSEIEREKAGRTPEIGFALLGIAREFAGANDGIKIETYNSGVFYKSVNSEFFVSPKKGLSVDMRWTSAGETLSADSVVEAVIEKLEEFGLKEETFKNLDENMKYYVDLGTVCAVRKYSEESLDFGCGNMEDYSEAFATLKPFYEAMVEGSGEDDGLTVMNSVTISDSFVTPYQQARAGVGSVNGGGGIVMWYRTSSNGKWIYFAGSQDTLSCELYNSANVKRAFAGSYCYDVVNKRDMMVMP